MKRSLWVCGWLAAVLLAAGCGGGDGKNRQEVSGRVTVDGAPLANGLIEFQPKDPSGPTPCSAPIKDGQFRVEKAVGPAPGEYLVRINVTGRTDAIPVPEGHKGPPPVPKDWMPPPLPERYNVTTELKATIVAGKNEVNFELKAK